MAEVKFLRGLLTNFNNLETKNDDTFYVTSLDDAQNYNAIHLGDKMIGSTLATDIIMTNYALPESMTSISGIESTDSVLSAIQKIDIKLNDIQGIQDGNFVTTFGGQTGDVTLKDASEDDGSINLSMNGNELQASIVGLGSAAFTESSEYATSTQGALADNALQSIEGDTFFTFEKSALETPNTGYESTMTVTYGDYEGNNGVATTNSTKDYIDNSISTSINNLDSTATIATKTDEGIVTLKSGIVQANGIITNNEESDITLSKVATTGAATDITFNDSIDKFTANNVDEALIELMNAILNLPKELVVKSGQIVDNPEGQPEGKYIELTLNDETEDKIYINVLDLVDIYTGVTADANTPGGVSISISASNEISATLIDNAVTTAKIVDLNVTESKLETTLATKVNNGEAAYQALQWGTI